MNFNTDERQSYLKEVCRVLSREGFEIDHSSRRPLIVLDGSPLCEISDDGGVLYRSAWINPDARQTVKDQVFDITCTVCEYMQEIWRAPPLQVNGLEYQYKQLADFNHTVFAAREGKHGVEFVTWDWDFNRKGLSHGHYYLNNYIGAKEDFAVRAGFIPKHMLFTEEQRIEIYRCCADTLDADLELTPTQEHCIRDVQEQIENGLPDIHERIREQDQKTEDILYPKETTAPTV